MDDVPTTQYNLPITSAVEVVVKETLPAANATKKGYCAEDGECCLFG